MVQAEAFLKGLEIMSEFELPRDPNDVLVTAPMLRAVLPEDFGSMLCGQLAPLCVREWRAATNERALGKVCIHMKPNTRLCAAVL